MFMKLCVEIVFMKKWICSFSFISILCFELVAQNIPVETWRTHFSYNNAQILETSGNKIFCATQNGLFSHDLTDQSVNKISKINGLSDARVSAMLYDPEIKLLVIGYESGLLDLIYEDAIFTVRDFKELNEPIAKEIFAIESYSGFVYLATNIGVIVVSLKENAITDNFRSIGENAQDLPVFDLLERDGQLYAITSLGIQYGNLSENLLDFNKWNRLDLPANLSLRNLTAINDFVIMVTDNNSLSCIKGDTIALVQTFNEEIQIIRPLYDGLGILLSSELYKLDYTATTNTLASVEIFDKNLQLNDFIALNEIWLADGKKGLLNGIKSSVIPNGPISDDITNIELVDGKLYAFYGPKPADFDGSYDSLGYDVFENGSWNYQEIDNFYNLVDVSIYNSILYFASMGHGLYNANDKIILNESNSILIQNKDATGILISDLAAGRSLWITSYDNNQPLVQINRDNDWSGYNSTITGSSNPLTVDVSGNKTLWITLSEGDINMLNIEDDVSRIISPTSGLPSSIVTDIELDINDEAWVATTKGIVNFSEASFVSNDIQGSGLVYDDIELYKEIEVTAVASDGGGRVWVASNEELAIYASNQSKRFFLFNGKNSPLPSGGILKMEYNQENGEMFILTDHGLLSYRSNSSIGNFSHSNVSIFPNPVRPDYTGMVGIKGVVADADIKITDINGKLIQNIGAFGGTASWDLKDYSNKRVQSGIYLIFSSSADGTETFVGKIAVIH
ncbi:MAG: hypothetical protein ACJA08_001526 [Cyclobacteriaceae bacterium]|jgi:hypothetical protein